jgi:hypothetical protein
LNSDKHCLASSLYGCIGDGLIDSVPSMALPMIHGAAFNELMPRHYAIANAQYRYEVLFFLYP